MNINIHPWQGGLWVVTYNGVIVSPPVERGEAEAIARRLGRSIW